MNQEDLLSGKKGLSGIQQALNGQSSRHHLRSVVQTMLRQGYQAGPFHLTRAKYKPDRKLSAYFTFSVFDVIGQACQSNQLAVSWGKGLGGTNPADYRSYLMEESDQTSLEPVHRELSKNIVDQGIQLQIWPSDPLFPQLARLGIPSYVAGMFTSLGITHDLSRLPVISPIRYRPGERHVLRYEVFLPGMPIGQSQHLYAKLYPNTKGATRAYEVANRVVDWLSANNLGLRGNKPAAISLDDAVIFYPPASGIPLSHQLNRSHRWLGSQLKVIGEALAILHNGPAELQISLKDNTFSNEAKVVKRASEHIQVLLPKTYTKILEILDKAEENYSRLPQEKPTFTHSDFKSDHIFTTPKGLTLIDFDTCSLSDPAQDIGKFLADLEWWFTRRGISGFTEAQAEVLKGYCGEKEPDQIVYERLRRARPFYALILVKIVVRRVPIFHKEWATTTVRMIDQAAQVLKNPDVHLY